ncbi:hypothetical protein [Oceanicola sp. 22II-s10i]|uniref:hypothetical protein n=1 Tax=Oceanicola sp. 22II-s10i TaxID=1317116 RepID=UPI001131FF16|nr:hypothetical protein [Oceanicola sp. 22II-s10i]
MVTLVLILVSAFFGLRAGWHWASRDEGAAIETVARDYVEMEQARGHAAAMTDCAGHPGASDDIWITVICDPPALGPGKLYRYDIDHRGRWWRLNPY